MTAYTETARNETLTRDMGITGKLVVGGTVSTGLLLGGVVVALLTLAGRLNGGALLPTSVGLFIVGALAGLVLSIGFGLIGRDDGATWGDAARDAAKGTLYAIPACLLGSIVAGWMGMSVIGMYLGNVLPIVGSVIAGVIALAIMYATFKVTCGAGANLLRRVRQVN